MVMFRSTRQLILLVGMSLLVVGCSGGDQYADIKNFMRDVENKPLPDIAPLPEFEPYQPFTYGASNRRSPFEAPIILPPKTEEQRRNVGVKPPADHVKQYLERFSQIGRAHV